MWTGNDIRCCGEKACVSSFEGGMEKAGQRDDSLHTLVQVIPVTFTSTENKKKHLMIALSTNKFPGSR